jgi:hypothetical protein
VEAGVGRVFISYRREDSSGHAGRLYDGLFARLGEDSVFMDVDSIGLGEDFPETLEGVLSETSVLLAIIGPRWLAVADDRGRRRLDDDDDFVRLEIERALARPGVKVIPVRVGGATMPRGTDLPDALRPLVRRQGIELSDEGWTSDLNRLVAALQGALSDAPGRRVTPATERSRADAESAPSATARTIGAQPATERHSPEPQQSRGEATVTRPHGTGWEAVDKWVGGSGRSTRRPSPTQPQRAATETSRASSSSTIMSSTDPNSDWDPKAAPYYVPELIEEAERHLAAGRWFEAERSIRNLLRFSPQDPDGLRLAERLEAERRT